MPSFDLNSKRPLIISGPCGAETERQTIDTCLQLAQTGVVDVLRAGIWKPRTAPGSFEGAGSKALRWLAKARKLTGLPVAVEVATARHAEKALAHGVDILWIGARTTVSPFAVQEVAEAVAGNQDINILVKNPMNPDLKAWAGAVDRFVRAGIPISNIGLIHRGFSYFGDTKYRNAPMWHLAFEMRNRFPDNVMLCDPSHIAGRREYLHEVSQAAANMCYDGLMIESHIDPDAALSDAAQQVTPEALVQLLGSIRWRTECGSADSDFNRELDRLRSEIDQIDSELFELMARRMEVAENIGHMKKNSDVAILQGRRWNAIVERAVARAAKLGLSEEFMRTVLEAIHSESIGRQNKIMNR